MSKNYNFKNDLKNIRSEANWTLVETSKKTGVPLRTLENWEAGTRTPPDYIARLILEKIKLEASKTQGKDETTIKYRLIKCSMQFKNIKDLSEGATVIDEDAKIIKIFDKRKNALDELKKYNTTVEFIRTFNSFLYSMTEYFIEEYEADEDGEFVSGSNFQGTTLEGVEFYDEASQAKKVFLNGRWVEFFDED